MKILGFEIKREQKASQTQSIIVSLPNITYWTNDFNKLFEEGYKGNDVVYSCVNYIAKACAGINWLIYREEKEIKHPLLKLFKRPNPQEGWAYFFQKVVTYLYITGNAYIEKVGTVPKELYCLRPDRIRIEFGDSIQPIKRYVYNVGERKVYFEPSEILHLKFLNPNDDWYGLSPIQVAGLTIDQNTLAKKWNTSLLKNSGRPSAVISSKEGSLGENTIKRIEESFREEIGYEHAGIVRAIDASIDYKETSITPKDMDWVNVLKNTNRQIAIDFHIPPELIGDSDNKTYSNYQEARKSVYTETILPLMDYFRDEFNTWLLEEPLHLEYDTDNIEALQEDRQLLWTRAREAVQAGIITPNEGREFLGYTTIKGANDLLMPSNLLPYASVPEMGEGLGSEEES